MYPNKAMQKSNNTLKINFWLYFGLNLNFTETAFLQAE